MPYHVDFVCDMEEPESDLLKVTFFDVEIDEKDTDWELGDEELEGAEASPTRSVGVFDQMGEKHTNKDL